MQNCVFVFPNRADQAAFSGGGWQPGLPLSLLADRDLELKARSVDLTPSSTQYLCELDQVRPIDWFAMLRTNLSVDARYRLDASDDLAWSYQSYDSGWQDVWPVMFDTDTLEWEDANWWDGRPTAEDLARYNGDVYLPLPAVVSARYWRLRIDDQSNPDGHVEIGRQVLGRGWRPRYNFAWASGIGIVSTTETKRLKQSGRKVYAPSPNARSFQFALNNLERAEAYGRAFELIRDADVHGEMLFVADQDDTVNLHRRSFYATLSKLDVLRHPNLAQYQMAFDLEEIL